MRERPILFSDAMLAAHQPHAAPSAPPSESDKEDAELPENCRQRLMCSGKPYYRSTCDACGKWAPDWRKCDAAIDAARAKKEQP